MNNYKHEIILSILFFAFCITFYHLYGIVLPFILGLVFAFAVNPIISKIQWFIKSRDLATTLFLIATIGFTILFFVFFTQYVNRDFQRFNQSFTILASNNQDQLDKTAQKVKDYLGKIYDIEDLQTTFETQSDSIIYQLKNVDYSQIDTETIASSFSKIVSIFRGNDTETPAKQSSFGFLFILFSTIGYFVLILYKMDYFISIRSQYLHDKIKNGFDIILDDFNQTFIKYFKLRTYIVLLLSLIYGIAFTILDMPGLILIIFLITILSYIPYLQYFALIPLALSCLVLSVETPLSFLFYFTIVVVVFIVASIVEELLLTPMIMEKNIGMNPVIMVLALSVWSYIFGLPGLIIGIPLTSLMIIYFKRYFLQSYFEVLED